jgi:hypothetical protein
MPRANRLDIILSFTFGATALLVVLVFSVIGFYLPRPQNPDILYNFLDVLQVILALAAGGVAAVIPGFITTSVQWPWISVRAGGALAVFLIVMFVDPSGATKEQLDKRFEFTKQRDRCANLTSWDAGSDAPGVDSVGAKDVCTSLFANFPNEWESHSLFGYYLGWFEHDWKEAEVKFNSAIEIFAGENDFQSQLKFEPERFQTADFHNLMLRYGQAQFGVIRSGLGGDYETAESALEVAMEYAISNKSLWHTEYCLTLLWQHQRAHLGRGKDWREIEGSWHRLIRTAPEESGWDYWCYYHLFLMTVQMGDSKNEYENQMERLQDYVSLMTKALENSGELQDKYAKRTKCYFFDKSGCPRPRANDALKDERLVVLMNNNASLRTEIENLVAMTN